MIVRPWRQPLMRMSLSRNVTSDNLAVEDNFTQRQSDNLAVSGDVGAQGGGFDPPLCSTGRYRGQSVPHTSHGTSIPVSHSSQDVRNDRYFYISGLDNENHGRGVSHRDSGPSDAQSHHGPSPNMEREVYFADDHGRSRA